MKTSWKHPWNLYTTLPANGLSGLTKSLVLTAREWIVHREHY